MILVGNQRGGAGDLARHLLKDENEHVVVHDLRGFASTDLTSALQESQAISRGTKCKQHLFSLSLNPPKGGDATPEQLVAAVEKAEKRLGLEHQPRAIIFHEKRGHDGDIRRHAHAVWCRIDAENMRAVQLSHTHRRLQGIARELYLEHGWTMPRGFVRSHESNPRSYTLAEWQQAKRAKKDPERLKAVFQDSWAISDTQGAFAHALKERGLILARGDRRGVVAVDRAGEVFAVSRWVGVKTKQVSEKIREPDTLPDVATAQRWAVKLVTDRLQELHAEQERQEQDQKARATQELARQEAAQARQAARLTQQQEERQAKEAQERQSRIRSGWRGLLDRITGKRKEMEARNRQDTLLTQLRDDQEKFRLGQQQADAAKALRDRAHQERARIVEAKRELQADIRTLQVSAKEPDRDQRRGAFKAKRSSDDGQPKRQHNRYRRPQNSR